jgi:beta-1,4-N-acetylglucosaminyltransferase
MELFVMKLLLVCNPGGHFSTMMGLKSFWLAHEREWVSYHKSDTEEKLRGEKVHWGVPQEGRDLLRATINFVKAVSVLRSSKPDMVISTGASMSVPFLLAGRLLGVHTVFIESISRSTDLSLSGKLVYRLVDEFYVQWPECATRYPKAQFRGVVL